MTAERFKKNGAAYEIVVVILTIIISGVLYVFLNYAYNTFVPLATNDFSSSYNATTTTWLSTLWRFFPVFIMFGVIFWAIMRVQKKKLMEGE